MTLQISTYNLEKLSKYVDILPGYAFKSERFTDDDTNIALVKGENVQQGFISWADSKYWPIEEVDDYEKYWLKIGDVVLAMDRPWVTAGLKWAYIKKHDPKSLLVQRVARLRSKSGLDQTYLRCLISSNYFSSYIQPIVTGVNVPHISGKQIGDFKIPVPDLPIQKKIAAILSTYDDLIENNKRRIALLEKMAEEIYREWFVRMRFPEREHFELEELPLREFIAEYIGGDWGSEQPSGQEKNPVHIVRGTDFDKIRQGDVSAIPFRYIKDSSLKNRKLRAGDIVIENSVNHQSRTSGKPLLITDHLLEMFEGDVICASFCKLLRPRDAKHSMFLFLNFDLLFRQGLFDYYQNIATNGIANLQVERFLDRNLLLYHSDINFDLLNQVDASVLALKLNKLKELRDKLLPRLISGKLPVENLDVQFPPDMLDETEGEATTALAKEDTDAKPHHGRRHRAGNTKEAKA